MYSVQQQEELQQQLSQHLVQANNNLNIALKQQAITTPTIASVQDLVLLGQVISRKLQQLAQLNALMSPQSSQQVPSTFQQE
jgi:hypothetical protein